ncbi:methyl-accepting chemotaxis protein [bacterium]|nr:methyl-accepting chemotaxis protein [bacterium]
MQISHLSLKSKIVGAMTLLVILVAGFVFLYFPSRQNAQAEQAKKSEIDGIAQILSRAIVAGLEFEDLDTVESVLAGVVDRKDLIKLEVLTPTGESFYVYNTDVKKEDKTNQLSASSPVMSGEDEIGELHLSVSLADLEVQKTSNRRAVLLASLVIIMLGGIFGYIVSHTVLKPISRIHAILLKISEGNGDLTQRIEIDTMDEIGKLSTSFNQFLQNLADLIGEARSSTERVGAVVEEISSISAQSASGAETQTMQTTEVAASVQQMTTAIMENSKNATQTSQISERAAEQAQEGTQSMLVTRKGMEEIVNSTIKTGEIITSLSGRAEEIGEIISVINDIADQTNLLALNAAIEAARAGEQGRGFAVVADEVRKLAERTMKATGEISVTIQAIQGGAQQAATSMSEAHDVVESGREATGKTESVLSEIVESVTQAMDMVTQIATASEEMSSGAEEISRNVETISHVTRESATGAEQMAQVANVLTDETSSLRELMNRFKLD